MNYKEPSGLGTFGTLGIKSGNLTIDWRIGKGTNYRYLDKKRKLLSLVNVSDEAEFILIHHQKLDYQNISIDYMATEQTLNCIRENSKYVKARLSVSL